jgi:hypothetical protein
MILVTSGPALDWSITGQALRLACLYFTKDPAQQGFSRSI